jgi:hypothetical protein
MLELQALQQNSCNISDLELQALQETVTISQILNYRHCNKYLQYLRFQPNVNRETRPASSPAAISSDDPRGPRLVGEQSVAPGWGTVTGPQQIWASSVAPCGSGLGGGIGMSSSTAGEVSSSSMADSRTSISSSSTVGEVGNGIPNQILVDGAAFGLLHPAPPSAKLRHNQVAEYNRREAAQI